MNRTGDFVVIYSNEREGSMPSRTYADEAKAVEAFLEVAARVTGEPRDEAGFPESEGWDFAGWESENTRIHGYVKTHWNAAENMHESVEISARFHVSDEEIAERAAQGDRTFV